jgi:N,N'-diacetyllegionaminate synthase
VGEGIHVGVGFDIAGRHVGGGSPCLIVAEVGQAHEGSLGQAHAYIEAIAQAGADAVKFQCHIAEAESTPDEPWRVPPEWPQDESRYAYWKRMEFTQEQWWSLAAHAEQVGLIFLCSPFSVEAVRLLDPMVPAWKLASGELSNDSLWMAMRDTDKPIIYSVGMSNWGEITEAIPPALEADDYYYGVAILQCTSSYPCPPDKVGLNVLDELRHEFECPVGLSDHSGTIWPGLAAVALGCDVLEVHVCFSKQEFGFDVESSITIDELARLVEGVRFIEKAKTPVDKDAMARELEPMRKLFLEKHKRRARAYAQTSDFYCGPCDTNVPERCYHANA